MSPERAAQLLEPASESNAGHVEAVVWARDDSGTPWPVLVLERAAEVFEHLVEWSEGSPATWFKLAWTVNEDEYALALLPRVDKSVERYKLARRLASGKDVPSDATFQVVFKPVLFHGPVSTLSRDLLPRPPSRVRVGFLSRAQRAPRRPGDA